VALAALALTVGVAGCRIRIPTGIFRVGSSAAQVASMPGFTPPRINPPPADFAHLKLPPMGARGFPDPGKKRGRE
jgi:hypothetical protein